MKYSISKKFVTLISIFFVSLTTTSSFATPPPQAPPTVRVAKVDTIDRSDAKT